MQGIHQHGMEKQVGEVMRKVFPKVKDTDSLVKVQGIMHEKGMRALPVVRGEEIIGAQGSIGFFKNIVGWAISSVK